MGHSIGEVVRRLAGEALRRGCRAEASKLSSVNGAPCASAGQCRTLSSGAGSVANIEAAVVLERLPVVLPPLHADVAKFRQFSFEWRQQHQRHYPQELLDLSSTRAEADVDAMFDPAPRTSEADRNGDVRSLKRSLKQRLYLVIYGVPPSSSEKKPVWHFPSKLYSKEPSLRQCAEAALGSLIGDISNAVYFVGNAPCGNLQSDTPSMTRFFFRSQLLASDLQLQDTNILDFAWITKQEVPLFFDEIEAKYLNDLLQ